MKYILHDPSLQDASDLVQNQVSTVAQLDVYSSWKPNILHDIININFVFCK